MLSQREVGIVFMTNFDSRILFVKIPFPVLLSLLFIFLDHVKKEINFQIRNSVIGKIVLIILEVMRFMMKKEVQNGYC